MVAKKIDPAELEALIVEEKYLVDGETLTICVLTIAGGFRLTGTSGCINPADFSATLGRTIARRKAVDRLWELEAYHRLRVHGSALAGE